MAEKPNLVHVQIFGQTYAVKAGTDPAYVEKLAAFVDGQMTEVSRGSGAVDSVRVAVLAALNIADECFRLREEVAHAGDGSRGARLSLAKRAGRRPRRVVREQRSPSATGRLVRRRRRAIMRLGSPALFVMAS